MIDESLTDWSAGVSELRDLIFDDADDVMQAAMCGSPLDCLFFAKLWIQRAKGYTPDQDWFRKP